MTPEEFTDVTYEVERGLAWITINRPERYNAFRARTVDELVHALKLAWADDEVGVVALTGAGEKAFCTGGDQKQRMETGAYGPSATGLFEVGSLHRVIRDVPKPVVPADQLRAEVQAWAEEILRVSPTALKVLKQSFNSDTEHFAGVGQMAYSALKLFGEAQEGVAAFNEKRRPEFAKYRSH